MVHGRVTRWQFTAAAPLVGRYRPGGQYLVVFAKLDLVVALNCGNYHRLLTEPTTVARAVVAEVVLPSFVWSLTLCRNVTRVRAHK